MQTDPDCDMPEHAAAATAGADTAQGACMPDAALRAVSLSGGVDGSLPCLLSSALTMGHHVPALLGWQC